MSKIMLSVGNESGEPALRSVSLVDYLAGFPFYIHKASDWKDPEHPSLLRPEEEGEHAHVLMSAQACFLPVLEGGGGTSFNAAIYNYQSRSDAPAVLAILSTVNGTSAQIVTNDTRGDRGRRYQRLYMNMDGKCCPLVGQLLKEWRYAKGQRENLDAPMTAEEKLHNAVMLIQVPLKHRTKDDEVYPMMMASMKMPKGGFMDEMAIDPTMLKKWEGEIEQCADCDFPDSDDEDPGAMVLYESASGQESAITPSEKRAREGDELESTRAAKKPKSTTRDAIVSVGEPTGDPFHELGAEPIKIKRDKRFPIRVTVQFYKTTTNGVADEDDMAVIAGQIAELRHRTAVAMGSLVTGEGDKNRTTEMKFGAPEWWPDFLADYDHRADFTESDEELAAIVFRNGRFVGMPNQQAVVLAYLEQRRRAQATPQNWGVV